MIGSPIIVMVVIHDAIVFTWLVVRSDEDG